MIQWPKILIEELAEKKFTGRLEINFFDGGIADINKIERLKPPVFKSDIKFDERASRNLSKTGY